MNDQFIFFCLFLSQIIREKEIIQENRLNA